MNKDVLCNDINEINAHVSKVRIMIGEINYMPHDHHTNHANWLAYSNFFDAQSEVTYSDAYEIRYANDLLLEIEHVLSLTCAYFKVGSVAVEYESTVKSLKANTRLFDKHATNQMGSPYKHLINAEFDILYVTCNRLFLTIRDFAALITNAFYDFLRELLRFIKALALLFI